jgi:hypothetical protein
MNFSYRSNQELSCQWLINQFAKVDEISIVISPYVASIGVGNMSIELNPFIKTKSDQTMLANLSASIVSNILDEVCGDVIQFEVTPEYFSVSSTFREFFVPILFQNVNYSPVSVFMPRYSTKEVETVKEYFSRMSTNDNFGWINTF